MIGNESNPLPVGYENAAWKEYFADTAPRPDEFLAEEMKYQVGDIVQFANITHDEFDRPIITPPSPLKVVRINDAQVPHRSFDYEVKARSGNHFYVYESEITEFVGV